MAESLVLLRQQRDAAEEAARLAESAAAKGDPDVPQQVEALAAKLANPDRQNDKLENPNGTVQ